MSRHLAMNELFASTVHLPMYVVASEGSRVTAFEVGRVAVIRELWES